MTFSVSENPSQPELGLIEKAEAALAAAKSIEGRFVGIRMSDSGLEEWSRAMSAAKTLAEVANAKALERIADFCERIEHNIVDAEGWLNNLTKIGRT